MNRQPAGSPVGGQFAPDSHAKKAVVIESDGLTDEEYAKWKQFGISFETLAYEWHDAGFTLDEAIRWRKHNFDYLDAMSWSKEGLHSPEEVIEWLEAGLVDENGDEAGRPKDIQQWQNLGFTPEEAEKWYSHFFATASKAAEWRDAGFGDSLNAYHLRNAGFIPEEAAKWRDADFGDLRDAYHWRKAGFTPDEAIKWRETGLDTTSAYNLHKSGFVPGEQWKAVGISPDESERWQKNRFSYDLAVSWHREGFTPEEAKEWGSHGFDPYMEYLPYVGPIPPSTWLAAEWRDAGFDPKEAYEWRKNDHDVNSAIRLKAEGQNP